MGGVGKDKENELLREIGNIAMQTIGLFMGHMLLLLQYHNEHFLLLIASFGECRHARCCSPTKR